MTPRKLNGADLAYLRYQLAKGRSYRDLATELGMHHSTIGEFVKANAPDLAREPDRPQGELSVAESRPMKLLVIDIETMANLAWTWGTWDQNIAPAQIVKHKRVLSWAAKWYGNTAVEFFSEFRDGREDMVRQAWDRLNAADGVIGYNSKKFDVKHLNTEFFVDGLTPPAPFAHIDLLQTVRKEFAFGSNKLAAVADRLGIGSKLEHEGFALWLKCEAGDAQAWKRMEAYNRQDVVLTEQLYKTILPWITSHPSYAAFAHSEMPMCPNCGHEPLNPSGYHHARTRAYLRYHCPACGHWARDRHAQVITETTETSSY